MTALTKRDYDEFLKLTITRDIVDRAGIFRVSRDEAAEKYAIHLDCEGAICFPYFLPPLNGCDTSRPVYYRARQDKPPRDPSGKEQRKYLAPQGKTYPYFPPIQPEWWRELNIPVLIVESPKSALAILRWAEDNHRQLIPLAVNGCNGWSGKVGIEPDKNGERVEVKDILQLLEAVCRGRRVYILFDANEKTNYKVRDGRDKLARRLLSGITNDVRLLHLPPSIREPFFNGPDDWLSQRDDRDFFDLFESAERVSQTEEPARPKIWNSRIFLAEKFPPRESLFVVNGFETPVLTTRSINQLFAIRGTGKSMLAMALAGVASTGGDFLSWKAVRKVRTLYVDGELPDAQIQQRMGELHSKEASISLVTLDSTPGGIPSLATAQGQAWLEKGLDDIELLILDSIASLAPFATNDEELWIPFSSWLMRLRSRGLCIFLLHQAGKLGLQRGHSRGDDALDVQIKLQAKEEESDHLVCELTYEKFRAQKAGVRALNIEYSNGIWKWSQLEADKIKLLEEYLCLHPNASSRKIEQDLPELGTYRTIQKLMKHLTRR